MALHFLYALATATALRAPAPLASSRLSPLAAATATPSITAAPDEITSDRPLRVLIAGAGVGGLTLANALRSLGNPAVEFTILEKTREFKRFGGPIQLASNAMQIFRAIDPAMYLDIESHATWTGNLTNGIFDGIRDEWYAKFDLGTPAKIRNMPYTCVVERPDLQRILLDLVSKDVSLGSGVAGYVTPKETCFNSYLDSETPAVTVTLEDGSDVHGDILIGADGIWSAVRATMRDQPAKGPDSGASYSGYTVFAGELAYDSADNGEVGYKVFIGPAQYFVITDIGQGRYQWYAFLARPEDSEASEPKPDGSVPYLKGLFTDWSPKIHDILDATREDEIEQRDLYDRPPSVLKPWSEGPATMLGDAVHAMMPNLGQGGCQAIEDAKVLSEELTGVKKRSELKNALQNYQNRRLLRSAAVQGLSRFASDIIIQGFDTPAKYENGEFQNFGYRGVVTRMLQPILPIFFSVQFNFLYSGWRNEPFALEPVRDFFILGPLAVLGGAAAIDAFAGGEILATWGGAFTEFLEGIGLDPAVINDFFGGGF